jgi:hypothetical protein
MTHDLATRARSAVEPKARPTSFLNDMLAVQAHLKQLRRTTGLPIVVLRIQLTDAGWVVTYRIGADREQALAVDALTGRPKEVPCAAAGADPH